MSANQESTGPEKNPRDADAKNVSGPATNQPSAPVEEQRKLKSKPLKKKGPSVIIGPGPGSDVVATPPSRI